jgi:hypothetical protein
LVLTNSSASPEGSTVVQGEANAPLAPDVLADPELLPLLAEPAVVGQALRAMRTITLLPGNNPDMATARVSVPAILPEAPLVPLPAPWPRTMAAAPATLLLPIGSSSVVKYWLLLDAVLAPEPCACVGVTLPSRELPPIRAKHRPPNNARFMLTPLLDLLCTACIQQRRRWCSDHRQSLARDSPL